MNQFEEQVNLFKDRLKTHNEDPAYLDAMGIAFYSGAITYLICLKRILKEADINSNINIEQEITDLRNEIYVFFNLNKLGNYIGEDNEDV